MVRTIIDVEGTPLRVQEARRMLTNWNKMVRGETISGVYRMRAKDIQEVMRDFTIKNGIIKHKTKAKGWSFNPKTLEAKTGKLKTTIPKYVNKKIVKKDKMPKPASVPRPKFIKKITSKKKRKLVIVDEESFNKMKDEKAKKEKSTPTPMKTEMPKKRRGRPKKIV
jgi:hypothetical protein